MFFHKTELLNTYSEESFLEAKKYLEENGIRYEARLVPTEDWRAGSKYHYYIYVKESEREQVYKLFRQELEIFAY